VCIGLMRLRYGGIVALVGGEGRGWRWKLLLSSFSLDYLGWVDAVGSRTRTAVGGNEEGGERERERERMNNTDTSDSIPYSIKKCIHHLYILSHYMYSLPWLCLLCIMQVQVIWRLFLGASWDQGNLHRWVSDPLWLLRGLLCMYSKYKR
jgi:hypothetical protein